MLIAWLAPAVAQVRATESARAQVRGSAVPLEVPAAPRRWFATAYRFASFAPSFHVGFRAEHLAQLLHSKLQWRDCNRRSPQPRNLAVRPAQISEIAKLTFDVLVGCAHSDVDCGGFFHSA